MTVIARREDVRHGGRATLGFRMARCGAGAALRRVTTGLAIAGTTVRRRRRGLGSAPARERPRDGRRPRSGQSPVFPAAAIGLVVLPVSVHAFSFGHSRSSTLRPGGGPALGVPEVRP